MKQWWNTQKIKLKTLFEEYGKVIFITVMLCVGVGLVYITVQLSSPQKLRVSFLDIGQGDSILIQTPSGKKMIIDGGPSNVVLTRLSDELSYFDHLS